MWQLIVLTGVLLNFGIYLLLTKLTSKKILSLLLSFLAPILLTYYSLSFVHGWDGFANLLIAIGMLLLSLFLSFFLFIKRRNDQNKKPIEVNKQ